MRLRSRRPLARKPSTWIVVGGVLCLALRAPWLSAPLGRDEAGLAFVADAWDDSGPFAYGDYFVDRPPVLLALFRLADGEAGVRLLGALAALAAVAIAVALARRVGGLAAVPGTAVASALLVSSVALGSVFTPAELIAIVPSSASVLLLVVALERRSGAHALFAAAGALAVVALLVKQSFGGALLAGLAALALLTWRRQEPVGGIAAYLAGAGSCAIGVEIWESLAGLPDGSVAYAIFGFRLDAVATLQETRLGMKLGRLPLPALGSGLVVALACSAVALRLLRTKPVIRAVLVAWFAGALMGVALGGSYWPHYLVALAPAAAVGTGIVLGRIARRWRTAAIAALAAPALAVAVVAVASGEPGHYHRDAVTVAQYLRERARPHHTAYMLYARPNILYYSGLSSPFPYHWSLLVRASPGARARLRALLASPRRPTWIVKAQHERAFGLDPDGSIGRRLERAYRHEATVCGYPVLLARGADARPPPAGEFDCDAGRSSR